MVTGRSGSRGIEKLPSMSFSAQLKAERERLGLTQAQAASLLSTKPRTYWEWENAKTTPPEIAQEGALVRLSKTKPPAKT